MAQIKESWTIWRLRRGMDRRFRSGHPWAYSNELMESPKGLEPGALVELQDAGGKFLARGYGNPKSLIAFRSMSRILDETDLISSQAVAQSLVRAWRLRVDLGLKQFSHRLCFGEADYLPGLVIDRYVISQGQVFVVQAHTAGADRFIPRILEILEKFVKLSEMSVPWSQTAVVLRNDLSVRKLEGLLEEEPRVLKDIPGVLLNQTQIFVRAALDDQAIPFHVDLLHGQKTGFFLDQAANIQLSALRLGRFESKELRILDLCCYVGQWGTQFSRIFSNLGKKVEVVAVDASAQALEFARKNIEAQGGKCEVLKADVLKDLVKIPPQSFDLVISDPPALIKSRKDVPAGTHAYLQLATQAIRLVKKGGGIIACSCSALLEEESFTQVLTKAAFRNESRVQWIGRGGQSPDHPMLTEFPEGRYLKGWIGRLQE